MTWLLVFLLEVTCVTSTHTSLAEVNHLAAPHLKWGRQRLILHGPRKGRTTKATAMSPVAKSQAMYFIGIIFMDSLRRLYEEGVLCSPVLQVGNGGQKWPTKQRAEPDWSWVPKQVKHRQMLPLVGSPHRWILQIRWVCKCSLAALECNETKKCHIHLR